MKRVAVSGLVVAMSIGGAAWSWASPEEISGSGGMTAGTPNSENLIAPPVPVGECIPPPCELPPVECERIKKLKARCRIDDAIGLMRIKVRRRVTVPDRRVDESVLLVINAGQPDQQLCCAIFPLNEKKAKLQLPGRIGPQLVQIVDPPRCPLQAFTDCE